MSSRCETPEEIVVQHGKPPALMVIDDRSWPPWDGQFPSIQQIRNFKPWWKG